MPDRRAISLSNKCFRAITFLPKQTWRWILLCIVLSSCNASAIDTVRFISNNPEHADTQSFDPQRQYYIDLLKLALDKSVDKFGEYELEPISAPMWQQRQLQSLKLGILDVVWTMTTEERENKYQPIRIPLMRGLIGFRVPLILKDSQTAFNDITTTSQLKKKMALQGHDWPDTQILQANGFKVEPTASYENFFAMLKRPDIHYIPRGLVEAFYEIQTLDESVYELADNHVLVYPTAFYFFTAKDNDRLSERLEFGLRRALTDGSFDKVFITTPYHKSLFTDDPMVGRTVHCLTNPLLPDNFPIDDPTLWMASINDNYAVCDYVAQ